MSLCCGASMIGTIGTVKHHNTYIHQVPILHCPICQSIEVYSRIKEDYEILADYAHSDHAPEVFFNDYVEIDDLDALFIDCIEIDIDLNTGVIKNQIDHALDLLSIAKKVKDDEWEKTLYKRLNVLSQRLRRHQQKETPFK
jgi:reverse gyrase